MTHLYDDPDFFNAYKGMERSRKGLSGAGEWHAFKPLIPELTRKSVLDLGSGYGWHAYYAAVHGADYILALDQSKKMIDTAKEKNSHPNIDYRVYDINQFTETTHRTFDVVLSSLVFHYIKDIDSLFQSIYRQMKAGASFIFTVEHPVFTADGSQDWVYENDRISHFPVDDYFQEGPRHTHFLGTEATKYHRTLTHYMSSLLTAGFTIKNVIEPTPSPEMMTQPGMKNELRRPMMLIIKVQK